MGRRNYKQESGSESLVYDFFRRAWALGSEERSLGRCTIERPECRMHWMGRPDRVPELTENTWPREDAARYCRE